MSARASALAYPSVDDKLGDRGTRFFGEGFKRVAHAVTHVSVTPATGTVEATAGLSLPGTWSQKGRTKQRPHLSTIDVMLLAAQLTGLYTGHTFEHDPTRFVVRGVKIRAGAQPDEDGLEQFPVHAVHRSTTDAPGGEQITTMDCRIGGMTITVVAAHPAGSPVEAPGFYAQAGHLPGVWNDRPYGVDHHTQSQLLTDVHADVADLSAGARLELTGKGVFTAIDLFVSALQLGQVLLYELDGVDRAGSNTLWMRRTDITIGKGPDTDRAYAAQRFTVRLEKAQELPTRQGTWRTARIRADHAGLSLACDVTHLLP
ncbi:AvrD family protein [Streptomyces sp. WELS2]|uniref:AvrD family protein n=1 Tax=Streptomyces sp. WELS2 TaxID=2749435 RepID=UPI0015F122FA|nr:AvrD family protein [Streptomyces sp. WELS2]